MQAIPDVSAQAENFRIFFRGQPRLIGGTSAASPTFAAIVSMLNDALISNNRPSMGFLNPVLYSKGFSALNDITVGNNPGCGTQGFNVGALGYCYWYSCFNMNFALLRPR